MDIAVTGSRRQFYAGILLIAAALTLTASFLLAPQPGATGDTAPTGASTDQSPELTGIDKQRHQIAQPAAEQFVTLFEPQYQPETVRVQKNLIFPQRTNGLDHVHGYGWAVDTADIWVGIYFDRDDTDNLSIQDRIFILQEQMQFDEPPANPDTFERVVTTYTQMTPTNISCSTFNNDNIYDEFCEAYWETDTGRERGAIVYAPYNDGNPSIVKVMGCERTPISEQFGSGSCIYPQIKTQ